MSEVQGLVIGPDGTISLQSMDVDGGDDLRTLVGGWIECAPCGDAELSFWVNEEGKLNGLPYNELGTALWYLTTPSMLGRDIMVGPVVITGGIGPEGETLTLPAGWAAKFASVINFDLPEELIEWGMKN